MNPLSVSELCYNINLSITQIDQVTVIGEVSGLSLCGKHLYGILKDNDSCINFIIWNNKFPIKSGDKIVATCKPSFYPKNGKTNIIINSLEKHGLGILFELYQKNKIKYESLGYFKNKKPEPKKIFNIALVTSIDGAALQDILCIFRQNNFIGKIFIKSCFVQGKFADKSIANSIHYFDRLDVDIVVVTRGGGSFEDLLPFSSENVIEALHNSKKYTISAVGHEIDHMLSDYVADKRYPTPSVFAEKICELFKKKQEQIHFI